MPRKLPQYLKIERHRSGLTQQDIALLLGVEAASKVSRYERGRRLPPLKTALAYEAILGKPIAQLFGGTYAAIRATVKRRAHELESRGGRDPRGCRFTHRKRSFQNIASR